ncbi:RNAse P Rpr2/Rpp21/SNM1 subunit domain-containing protein [Neurospora hispaniola]|uniref:RNAse P Rpr2/Rpp21/SNM1 subunit domain-containing protein n=1 Tax=Neurospora hispaniola TaxID=588809 RepID=A0AAJ0I459_9PEZI|nr:RNAse P Rpr2/Rpp21/SNM1 subunit domain-containing protein [Neurospora hispaniola]
MAKGGGKNNGGVQNRAIYSRVSFLQQAAVFLSRQSQSQHQQQQQSLPSSTSSALAPLVPLPTPLEGMSRRLATDLRSVSLKTRIRLSPAVKRTICKYCDSLLIDGSTCTAFIENRSKGGRKPWADILVRRCHACKKERRYPIEAKRTKRKTERGISEEDAAGGDAMEVDGPPVAGKGKGQKQQGQKQKQKQPQGQTEVEVGEQKG